MAKERKIILIADDNSADARFLQRNLEKVGVHLPTVLLTSGKEVINYLQQRIDDPAAKGDFSLPDILFLDLKLGDMDGTEVLQWITSQPSLRRLLVIIHSGIATPRDIDALYAAGANSFLRKANDFQELKLLVEYFKGYFS
ncbi:MAG: response regulator [Verrucomicrobiales bacterium]